jgi:hypothetical protein
VSALARRNGWRGFDGIGTKVERGEHGNPPTRGGWRYYCDGMPTLMGCGSEVVVTRRFTKVGKKATGWLVCYGRDLPEDSDDGKGNDLDVVLTFCPRCAAVVLEQDKKAEV